MSHEKLTYWQLMSLSPRSSKVSSTLIMTTDNYMISMNPKSNHEKPGHKNDCTDMIVSDEQFVRKQFFLMRKSFQLLLLQMT